MWLKLDFALSFLRRKAFLLVVFFANIPYGQQPKVKSQYCDSEPIP